MYNPVFSLSVLKIFFFILNIHREMKTYNIGLNLQVPLGLDHYWKPKTTLVSAYKIDCGFLTVNWISTEKIPMSTLIWMDCHAGGTQWLSPTKYTFCCEGTTWFTSGVTPCNWDLFHTSHKNVNIHVHVPFTVYHSVINWYKLLNMGGMNKNSKKERCFTYNQFNNIYRQNVKVLLITWLIQEK